MTGLSYIPRTLEPILRQAVQEFPVVVLTGPRQSGKTTLYQHVFGGQYRYVSLEPPDIQAAANADPRGFLALYPPPVIFDEIQYTPVLLPYIKEKVDARRGEMGQYLLTGSQNLLLMEKMTETLAGRAAFLKLLPLTLREIQGEPGRLFPWELPIAAPLKKEPEITPLHLWKNILHGGYPELSIKSERDARLWYSSYVQTYLERDVRTLRQIGDLTQFQAFLRLLATRSGQLLNLSDMARDLGLALNTLKSWISVLEATYQIIILRPYFNNMGKRLVKTPKIYWMDTGMLCYLVGLNDPTHAMSGPMAGAIFETAVVSEIVKSYFHRGLEPQAYFWRTSSGIEVDLLIESAEKLIPIEVKLSATPQTKMTKNIALFLKDYDERVSQSYLIHSGSVYLPLGNTVMAWPFNEI